jgi:hypothetical protein
VKASLPLLLSFGLAFAAGWWGVRERVNPWAGDPVSPPASRLAGQRSKDQPVTADGLVAKHTAKKPGDPKKAQAKLNDWLKTQEEQKLKFESLKDSFVLDSDPAKQYEAAMERYKKDYRLTAEIQLISLAWLRQDADGFLAFLAKTKGDDPGSGLYGAVKERCRELSLEQNLELLGKLEAASQSYSGQALFSHLVASSLTAGRLEDVLALADQLQPRQKNSFYLRLAIECPEKLRPEAFKWFADHAQIQCLQQMAARPGQEVSGGMNSPWLGEMVERYPETRATLVNSGLYQGFMMDTWTKLPVAQGLAEMVAGMPGTLSDEAKRVKALEVLCANAAGAALAEQGDLRRILGNGHPTMEQIVDQMGPRAKELFATAPDEMRKAIFPQLALHDPEAAVALTEPFDPKVREQLLLKAATGPTQVREGNAEQMLKLFTALPPSKDQGPLQARFMAWGQITDNAYRTYGDSYPAWLLALPNSVDRDMALSHLAMAVKGTDPELGARLVAAKSQTPPAQ